jgi:peptidyl-prolyl cis-trans isomerase B (cyclophilin B)
MLRHFFAVAAAAITIASASVLAANPQVELDTTAGKIRLELYPEAAPKTVENFLTYVKDKHYDGTQFHRVIDGFMIQGGGFTTDFTQKPTRPPIPNEAEMSSKAGLLNAPGTVAMARTSDPNSATAQFFINVNDNTRLNFRSPDPGGIGYTVFGKVVAGMDVVNRIAKVAKGSGKPVPPGTPLSPADVPTEPVVIKAARVVDAAKSDAPAPAK